MCTCFEVKPPKGPFGIKIRNWWIFLLTLYILLATIGCTMVLLGLYIACFAAAKISVLTACILALITIVYARRAARYWKLLYGPWFTGVTLPVINAKLPELNLNDTANVQRLDKIGAEFYEGPEQEFDGPEGS